MTTSDSPPLDTIGSYDLLEQVGGGSMGAVYRARHWESKAIVAIKVMHAEVARNPVLLKRFEQEFRITSRLDHPNIVKMIEFCGTEPKPYLVMEYIEGESLIDRLERDGKIPEEEAVRLIVEVAHGLHRAHKQGLIHRDVKPDNIMVTRDGQAKLLDLGLAKDVDSGAELTRAGQGMGTPDFMAPEQFRNAKHASVRCDIYSLGATLYMMVTGRYPFDEEDPLKTMMRKLKNELPAARDVVPEVSERTSWAIRRAMSADPEKRPESCREFAEDLLGESTRQPKATNGNDSGLWYVVYTDSDGMARTIKGSTEAIRQSVRDGRLGTPQAVRGSRIATGPFEPLSGFVEFRDLLIGPAPGPALSEETCTRLARLAGSEPNGLADSPAATSAAPSPAASPGSSHSPSRWLTLTKLVALIGITVAATLIVRHFLSGR
jgi:serine/threonine protein kinase